MATYCSKARYIKHLRTSRSAIIKLFLFPRRKNTPILNHIGQNLPRFLAEVGAVEEDSGASMLPASAILENGCLALVM